MGNGSGVYSFRSKVSLPFKVFSSVDVNCRSHGFYYIFSAFYVAELISSFVASITIDISPWIPCSLAMGAISLCFILLAVMPDPRSSGDSIENYRNPSPEPNIRSSSLGSFEQDLSSTSLLSILSNRNVLLIIPIFLVGIFRYTTLNVLIQYASVRFDLKISTGATFYTETAIVNIFLFLFIVPQLTAYIRSKYDVRSHVIDLFLVRMSVAFMCLGCLAIGLAQHRALLPFGTLLFLNIGTSTSLMLRLGVCIFAAGFGSRVSALALVSHWISDNAKATMYAAIVVLESLGHAIGDPSMQQIFAASLQFSPFWMATPFFVAAVSWLWDEIEKVGLTPSGFILCCNAVYGLHTSRYILTPAARPVIMHSLTRY